MERNCCQHRSQVGLLVVLLAGVGAAVAVAYAFSDRPTLNASPVNATTVAGSTSAAHANGSDAAAARGTSVELAVKRGRYLVRTSGCNDCHTPGFMQFGEKVPEAQWLTGVPVGWRGPWGTTYAPNLRLSLKDMKLEDFITIARSRNDRPPMPWPSLHAMSDEDLAAVYSYIKSLPVAGERMPEGLNPEEEPKTPYLSMFPVMPGGQANNSESTPKP